VTDNELDLLALKWLQVCASCDAGLPYGCSHPNEDYRPVIANLIDEVRRLWAEIAAAERRGAERAAQAIEAEPRFRDSMTGAALWVGNIAAKRAREAVPKEPTK
jgi:hypothetical protein